jgi:hypothetical protein
MGRYMWRLPVLAIGAVTEVILAGVLAFDSSDLTKSYSRDGMLLVIFLVVPLVVGVVARWWFWASVVAVAIPVGSIVAIPVGSIVHPPPGAYSGLGVVVVLFVGTPIACVLAVAGTGLSVLLARVLHRRGGERPTT